MYLRNYRTEFCFARPRSFLTLNIVKRRFSMVEVASGEAVSKAWQGSRGKIQSNCTRFQGRVTQVVKSSWEPDFWQNVISTSSALESSIVFFYVFGPPSSHPWIAMHKTLRELENFQFDTRSPENRFLLTLRRCTNLSVAFCRSGIWSTCQIDKKASFISSISMFISIFRIPFIHTLQIVYLKFPFLFVLFYFRFNFYS